MTKATIKWNMLILAYISLFMMGLIDNSRGPVYPDLLKTFSFTTAQGSLIFSIASGSGLIINITSRYWLKWVGAAWGIHFSLAFMFLGTILMGASPSLPLSTSMLYIASFILGIGLSGCGIAMNILVGQGAPEKYRRRAFAGLHSTYGIASFVAPFFIFLTLKMNYLWNQYFIILSFIPLLFIILMIPITPNKKDQSSEALKQMLAPFNLAKRLPYAILFGSYVASEVLVSSRLVLVMQEVYNYSEKVSGQMLSLFFFCLTAGRLTFAFLPITKIRSTTLMYSSLIGAILLYLLGYFVSPWFYPLTALSMSFFFPVGIDWLSERFPQHSNFMTATAMTSIGFALIIGHFTFGEIAKVISIQAAFWIVPICSSISLVTLFFLAKVQLTRKVE